MQLHLKHVHVQRNDAENVINNPNQVQTLWSNSRAHTGIVPIDRFPGRGM